MKNYISVAEITKSYGTYAGKKYKEVEKKWDKNPSDEERGELRRIIESYLHYAESEQDRELIQAVLNTPEIFNRAKIVTDGSYLSIYFLAYKIKKQQKINFWLIGSVQDSYMFPDHAAHIGQRSSINPNERIKWILDNYQTIPFICQPLDILMNKMEDY